MKNSKDKGITLVALVVTIVVLLILAGVTITYVFSDNGILSQAQSAASKTDAATTLEEIQQRLLAIQLENTDTWTYTNDDVQAVIEEVTGNEVSIGDSQTTTADGTTLTISSLWIGTTGYDSSAGLNTPKLGTGMTPIKYDETAGGWVETTEDDEEWYSYTTTDKQWANAVINGTFGSDGVLDETADDYTMWVWIPRFAYQIYDNYHNGGEDVSGTINIKFMVGTTDVAADGTSTWDYASGEGNWNIHPAFEYSETVTGLWVAKFEASRSDSTSSSAGSSTTISVRPGVRSWRSISVNDIYTNCLNYNSSLNSHMMKNSEWGAVAYLAQSAYGKEDEIWINPNSRYITGQAGTSVSAGSTTTTYSYTDTTYGVNASSTGNVYGIYDLSGGAYEYVAAYVDNTYTQEGGNRNTSTYGASLIAGADYTKDVYSMGTTDTQANNYAAAGSIYGDAVYETSSSSSGTNSWYYDFSDFVGTSVPFFARGGNTYYSTSAGTFAFCISYGDALDGYGFRPVLAVL